jgi:DMSO/TMAO reductase YedYZ molybdopterin-dependent catalytic subunit
MDKNLTPIDRRRFLQWLGGGLLLGGAAVLGLRGCGLPPAGVPLVPGTTPPAGTFRNWSWEIRWIGGTPQADLATWQLTINGLVKAVRVLTMEEIRALPATTLHLRMKCVECWSGPAEWTGVAGRDLLALVEALPEAAYVTLYALDGYTSTLSIADIVAERVLFVYGMDGQDLPVEQGFPLRLIAPSKYGYKCVKAISRLEFVANDTLGFWEARGYDNVGTIQPGFDHPLDLGRTARPIEGGEITNY